jgi:biopolymer transport protein ExbD
MAQELNVKQSGKSKKTVIRMDMTPLVDLGFLLVTFFILTSAYTKPQAMKLQMPQKQANQATMHLFASGAITVFLGKDNRILYRKGLSHKLQESSFDSIGTLLAEQKRQHPDKYFVVIKATRQAKYKNLVDVLDELTVRNILKFSIDDLNAQEKAMLRSKNVQ